jgi:hypothetical protein
MTRLSQIVYACRALELPDTYEPVTKISVLMSNVGLQEIITCLRSSEDGNAQLICAYYDRLNPSLQKVITIDHLIAAARCKNPIKVAGLITETYCQAKQMESQIIAAGSSPDVMKAAVRHAKRRDGFQHSKMVLQTVGVAPVPVNQRNILIGNRFQQQNNVNITVPSHEQVAGEVDEALMEMEPPLLPANVPSSNHIGKEIPLGEEDEEEDN